MSCQVGASWCGGRQQRPRRAITNGIVFEGHEKKMGGTGRNKRESTTCEHTGIGERLRLRLLGRNVNSPRSSSSSSGSSSSSTPAE